MKCRKKEAGAINTRFLRVTTAFFLFILLTLAVGRVTEARQHPCCHVEEHLDVEIVTTEIVDGELCEVIETFSQTADGEPEWEKNYRVICGKKAVNSVDGLTERGGYEAPGL